MNVDTILIVDDNASNRNLIEAYLGDLGCRLISAADGEAALAAVDRESVDLVLLDVQMPGMGGLEVCRRLKLNPATRLIPVVMVTALSSVSDRVEALNVGADDFLGKPVERVELLARVSSLLRLKHVYNRLQDTEQVIRALARAVEAKDQYTEAHTERVASNARMLGAAAGLDPVSLDELYLGGSIHDIGKIGIPDAILLKRGALNAEEIAIMRTHPVLGEEIVRPLNSSRALLSIVRSHHEQVDGSGYPDGLSGEEIPVGARIVAICDAYDALVSDRPYRSRLIESAAIHILREGAGRQWDAELVQIFTNAVLPRSLEILA